MNNYLWKLKKEKLSKTNLYLYSNFVEKNFKIKVNINFNKLLEWSVKNTENFWKSIWNFTKVKGKMGNTILQRSSVFYKNKFFVDAKLNYAENLLIKNNNDLAIIFKSENGYKVNLSWKNLNLNVNKVSSWMKSSGSPTGQNQLSRNCFPTWNARSRENPGYSMVTIRKPCRSNGSECAGGLVGSSLLADPVPGHQPNNSPLSDKRNIVGR